MTYSAALCRGLIEASVLGTVSFPFSTAYSAALCRGLIEAFRCRSCSLSGGCIPRLYAAASLKQREQGNLISQKVLVFRGFMPRPH